MLKKFFFTWFECTVWIAGLAWLAWINPAGESHFSLCFFKWMGLSICPGCGLGHSVSWIFHGDIRQSLLAHPLGILAVMILLYRIATLTKNNLFQPKLKINIDE